jgi:hypothetical protein
MEIIMFTSLTKKISFFCLISTVLIPTLYGLNIQQEYCYLSMLIHNANAPAFTTQLNQLATSPEAKTATFREMLVMLAQDVEHAALNAGALHGADIRGNIADNGLSQCKWGLAELGLAAILFKFHPEYQPEIAQKYYGMLATGIGSGILGIVSLKNGLTNYFFARRYGTHIQKTLESLEIIKQAITAHLNT